MKQYDILDLFITGELIHENVSKVEVNEYTESMKWLVGAIDDVKPGKDIPFGEYLVYYSPAELNDGSGCVKPDYTLHDEYDGEIYMIRIDTEEAPQADDKPQNVYLQDMTIKQATDVATGFIKRIENTDDVDLCTMAVGDGMFEVMIREEDGLEVQQLLTEAKVRGEKMLFGIEWNPANRVVLGAFRTRQKKNKK